MIENGTLNCGRNSLSYIGRKENKGREIMKNNSKLVVWIVGAVIVVALVITAMITSAAKNETLATVDGNKITKDDLYNALVVGYGKDTLNTLISNKIVELEAKKRNIKVTDEEIQKELEVLYQQYGNEDTLKQQLKASGSSFDALKKDIVQYLKTKKLIEPTIKISDEEISAYFEQNKKSFAQAGKKEATLEDNKEAIKEALLTQKLQTEFPVWLEKKKTEYKVTNNLDKKEN